jgi:hypothetical protein
MFFYDPVVLGCLRDETHALAVRCRNESPSLQNVLIDLRLLALQARHRGRSVRAVARQPADWYKKASTMRVVGPKVRIRIYLSMRWKPLARLVFALLGK